MASEVYCMLSNAGKVAAGYVHWKERFEIKFIQYGLDREKERPRFSKLTGCISSSYSFPSVEDKSTHLHLRSPKSKQAWCQRETPLWCPSGIQALSTETGYTSSPSVETEPNEYKLLLELAKSEEKLRAAATLRARSFYKYPEGRSFTAQKTHQKMKAEDEFAVLTKKVGGLELGYKHTSCFVASCHSSNELVEYADDLCDGCMVRGPSADQYVVVGTLDLNQGLTLPGEIIGDYPVGPNVEMKRAYLSNVCVAEEVRRRGVGMLLVEHAKRTAKLWGITDLYVHVVADNTTARKLYEKAGFVYEKEESVKEARSQGRARRYLLRIQLA